MKREISLESALEDTASASAPYMWASMKIESLDGEYDLNRGEIRRLGKEFGIPTRETSLIVLETVEDYVRYDIDPPSDLKPEFDRLRASAVPRRGDPNKPERVISEWKSRIDWWEKDFPKGPLPKPKENKITESVPSATANMPEYAEGRAMPRALPAPVPTAQAPDAAFSGISSAFSVGVADEPVSSAPNAPVRDAAVMSIALRPWSPDEPYIRRMKEARDEDLYRIYLDERPDHENSVPFFIDVSYQLS